MSMTANEPDLERGLDGVSLGLPSSLLIRYYYF